MMAVTNLVSSAALALLCAQSLLSTLLVAAYRRGLPRAEIPGSEPNVAVILPVRGGRNLDRFLPLLRAQQYGRYRIIASVESTDDSAFALLRAAEAEPGAPLETTVAGLAANAGQKVWNQLAALERLRPDDDIVAFIDADTLPTPLWLPRLVAVIVNAGRPVATGYRWMTPADDRWSSCCLAAANASIAALPRGVLPMTIVWGGSVAMKQKTLEAIAIEAVWRGAISDDVQMAEALRRHGLTAHAPRQGLLLSPVSCSWREMVAFGVRQYRIIYLHQPGSWAIALVFLWAPPIYLALAAPSFVSGLPAAWLSLALILALAEVRTRLRRGIQRALWPELCGPRDARRWRAERWLRPVWLLIHALCAAGAPLSRTIDWAGVRYRVAGPQNVVVERRSDPC
ncbi:MAG: glycosyltransferase family 2 protein [Roseiarcus sp.]|uniref:glycosyltransferase family 2 protein n=1 Tax=Roseiarcus sp. TaxID=1969460 RepID=UPI003BAE83FC